MTTDNDRNENVDHPSHYGGAENPYEVIKVLEAWLTPEAMKGFCLGNVIKYIARADLKNGMEDLKKAKWYLDYYIEYLERKSR
jgi:hypothetical protein